jgi:hypothetical protein
MSNHQSCFVPHEYERALTANQYLCATTVLSSFVLESYLSIEDYSVRFLCIRQQEPSRIVTHLYNIHSKTEKSKSFSNFDAFPFIVEYELIGKHGRHG